MEEYNILRTSDSINVLRDLLLSRLLFALLFLSLQWRCEANDARLSIIMNGDSVSSAQNNRVWHVLDALASDRREDVSGTPTRQGIRIIRVATEGEMSLNGWPPSEVAVAKVRMGKLPVSAFELGGAGMEWSESHFGKLAVFVGVRQQNEIGRPMMVRFCIKNESPDPVRWGRLVGNYSWRLSLVGLGGRSVELTSFGKEQMDLTSAWPFVEVLPPNSYLWKECDVEPIFRFQDLGVYNIAINQDVIDDNGVKRRVESNAVPFTVSELSQDSLGYQVWNEEKNDVLVSIRCPGFVEKSEGLDCELEIQNKGKETVRFSALKSFECWQMSVETAPGEYLQHLIGENGESRIPENYQQELASRGEYASLGPGEKWSRRIHVISAFPLPSSGFVKVLSRVILYRGLGDKFVMSSTPLRVRIGPIGRDKE